MTTSDNTQRWYAAIGKACTLWSDIEWFLENICSALAPFHSHDFENDRVKFVLSQSILHMDIRNRVAFAKVLLNGAMVPTQISTPLEKLLNQIDNEMRSERNRMVHDEWLISEQWAMRSQIKPKIINTQSRTRELTMTTDKRYETIEELEDFTNTLQNAIDQIIKFCIALEAEWKREGPRIAQLQQAAWPNKS